MNFRSFFVLLWTLALTGCATVQPLDTSTGKPQKFFPNLTVSQAQSAFLAVSLADGMNIYKQTHNLLVMDKPVHGLTASIFMGSEYNPTPDDRLTYQFAQENGGVEVFVRLAYVTNPGSQYEQVNPTNADNRQLQRMLEKAEPIIVAHYSKKLGHRISADGQS